MSGIKLNHNFSKLVDHTKSSIFEQESIKQVATIKQNKW
jgi:hypothetical protein